MPPAETLIDELLAEQRLLTPVGQFARQRLEDEPPSQARFYRELLPLSTPLPGEQYAFAVDLDKCTGCKACVAACHALNGLDDGEVWREVGLLVSDDWRRPFQQAVTTACHHCIDPGCLNGCPVLAYEKDPVTGIVRHLDDQCIGCQYCVLKCPYDVPKYSAQRGIVRKCDMCSQRLAAGEAPACVQACPNEAIRITVVDQEALRIEFHEVGSRHADALTSSASEKVSLLTLAAANRWLPASPDPAITVPTTRYISKRHLPPDLIPADAFRLQVQPAHWPLAWMLTLTQLAAGAFALVPVLPGPARLPLVLLALAASVFGLSGGALHLGRPLKAWRSFLGLKKSWLSREIVVFALFVPLGTAAATALGRGEVTGWANVFLCATAFNGLLGVLCSGMIYHDTRRVFWRGVRSVGRFFGTAAVLGLAAAWVVTQAESTPVPWLPAALALVVVLKLAGEHRMLRRANVALGEQSHPKPGETDSWSLAGSAILMRDQLGLVTRWRFFLGVIGGIALPFASFLPGGSNVLLTFIAFTLCFPAELAERSLFFRAVVPPRMPGAA